MANSTLSINLHNFKEQAFMGRSKYFLFSNKLSEAMKKLGNQNIYLILSNWGHG
jgi:hypothetical protein